MNPQERKEEELLNHEYDSEQEVDCTQDQSEEINQQEENEELNSFETQLTDMQDKYLRLAAEFDNYRKRTIKEKAELIKNGGEKVISSILPIIDDLERALQTIESSNDIEALKEGVDLIYQKFINILKQNGLEKINTVQDPNFNTDYHEAIALVPAPDKELKGKILDTVQNGYILNDKVIRHSKVVVGE